MSELLTDVQIGIAIANLCMPIQERLYKKHCEKHGVVPEGRLYPMMLGAL